MIRQNHKMTQVYYTKNVEWRRNPTPFCKNYVRQRDFSQKVFESDLKKKFECACGTLLDTHFVRQAENATGQGYFPKTLLYSYIQSDIRYLANILFMNFPISITPATFTFNTIFRVLFVLFFCSQIISVPFLSLSWMHPLSAKLKFPFPL